ncbi:MAG TPA: BON domain-containing protein [Spongiibacteraceae bacterium]
MSNPYSQNQQHYSDNRSYESDHRSFERNRNERWSPDDYRGARPTWREENSNQERYHNRSRSERPWGEEGSSGYGQPRRAQNFEGEGYPRNLQASRSQGYADEYGYYGSELQAPTGRPWPQNEDYENYGAQQDYHLGNTPSGRSGFGDNGNFGNEGPRWSQGRPYNESRNYRPQWGSSAQNFSSNRPGASNYPQQDQEFNRGNAQSAGAYGQTAGAYGLQQKNYRGLGPKGYTRADEKIREDICERLSDDPRIDASDISVEVRNGTVTLEGSVTDRVQKHRVEDVADSCSGVKDVHNGLRVTRGSEQPQTTASASAQGNLSSSSESIGAKELRESASKSTKQ